MSSLITPFQLLEVNVISAQDVAPVRRNMRSYAVAWVHPDRKLSTHVDNDNHINPTWNDKFVFRVNDEFLRSDTAAVMVEIYAQHWFRNAHVGTVRVLVGNLIPPPTKPHHHNHHIGMRFIALQVRRPSGRPQGILNIGVALLDSSMRSMPLYTQVGSSAVGYRDLMGEEDPHAHHPHHGGHHSYKAPPPPDNGKPVLGRSQSDRSEFDRKPALEEELSQMGGSKNNGSEIGATGKKSRSRPGSDVGAPTKGNKRSYSKPGSLLSGLGIVNTASEKSISAINIGPDVVDPLPIKAAHERKLSKITECTDVVDTPKETATYENPFAKLTKLDFGSLQKDPLMTTKSFSKFPQKSKFGHRSVLSDSVGPSASELAAAAVAVTTDEATNSMLEGWSVDESVEGLRSKLERWRAELPTTVYDRSDLGSLPSSGAGGGGTTGHFRRHTDGGGGGGGGRGGLFSCFGNIYGYECSCVCGKPAGATATKGSSGRVHLSPSMDSFNRSYI